MRDRTSLLLELIAKPGLVAAVTRELLHYGEYCESHLVIVTKLDVLDVLKLFEGGEFSADEIKAWANAISGRTDIGFEFGESGVVEESLYWLANPEINWPIDAALCRRIVTLYERRKSRRN